MSIVFLTALRDVEAFDRALRAGGAMASRAEVELVLTPLGPEVPAVIVDRTRFKQILMNYGSNAIK